MKGRRLNRMPKRRSKKAKRAEARMISRKHYLHLRRAEAYGQFQTDITPKWLKALWRRSRTCPICELAMLSGKDHKSHPRKKTLDHKKPLSRGGAHTKSNVWVICATCHEEKDRHNGEMQNSEEERRDG